VTAACRAALFLQRPPAEPPPASCNGYRPFYRLFSATAAALAAVRLLCVLCVPSELPPCGSLHCGPSLVVRVVAAMAAAVLGPCGLAACSDPPVVPSGPLGLSPDPPAVPYGPRGVSVPSGPFGVPPIPPRVLRCPWCLLDPTAV
jgi:hypothetical protein